MKYKDICSWIRQQAKILPDEGYAAREYYFDRNDVPDNEEDPHFMAENGRIFRIGEYKVNHVRRLKNIWKKTKDFNQINEYFGKFGFQLNQTL